MAGLDVVADRPADSTREMLVTVTPGMAVDQFGRTINLRDEQCARLGAWYARQVQDGTAPPADEETGRLRAYVVAAYDECLDALVPIPGQPCSSSDTLMAPSRIRDSFRFEIRWSPPPMTAWDADRAFADLLALVRFEAGLPVEASDEAEIVTRVRALAAPPAMEMCAPAAAPEEAPPVLRLPKEGGRATLDRIFTVWVTEVRPAIVGQADLIDPALADGVDPAVLLACIDFLPAEGFDPADPEIAEAAVSDIGRPFLLHTQLIQELLLLGGGDATALKEIRPFATLEVRGPKTLWLWLHHGQPLDFVGAAMDALQLAGDGAALALADVQPVAGFDNLFDADDRRGHGQRPRRRDAHNPANGAGQPPGARRRYAASRAGRRRLRLPWPRRRHAGCLMPWSLWCRPAAIWQRSRLACSPAARSCSTCGSTPTSRSRCRIRCASSVARMARPSTSTPPRTRA